MSAIKKLWLLLAVSWAARAALCLNGGQLFFPDENRYPQAYRMLYDLSRGAGLDALDTLLRVNTHVAFTIAGMAPAALHTALVLARGMLPVWPSFLLTIWFPACALALASVASIALTYALARKMKAGESEALLAAFFMACSNVMFYYSRHLLPYDMALALALAGLWLALDENPTFRRSLACGAVLGFSFMTHHGHWPVVGVVAAVHALYGARGWPERLRRCAAMALTGPALMALLTLLSLTRGMTPYVLAVKKFMDRDVLIPIFGDYAEGWRLPWDYFWSAEHGMLLAWLVGAALCLRLKGDARRRGLLWLALAGGHYFLIAFLSTGLQVFPVHARIARQMIPFLCLAAACGWSALPRRPWLKAGLAALALQAAFNFKTPLALRFPHEIRREVALRYGKVSHASVIAGSNWDEADDPSLRYVLVNAQFFFPVDAARPAPAGNAVFETPHPLQYRPYQYDDRKPEARALLRSADLSIRLLERAR